MQSRGSNVALMCARARSAARATTLSPRRYCGSPDQGKGKKESLNPEKDPLCALLIIDYCAVRGGEYRFLIDLFHAWEPHRNLSQLPNFAFSVPLAMFHSQNREEKEGESGGETEANKRLQDALLMFPCLLPILLDKCGVTLDPAVTSHSFFIEREPNGLKRSMLRGATLYGKSQRLF
ncbi:Transcription factor 25 [Geodia barretti]|uniref:Transcription factor 25 n=1 Tax=Geodia barretti TaxID=519541 RepID=A0AA35T427_GEOBA|nr:Transcription factor 25 [Geodia barretti]